VTLTSGWYSLTVEKKNLKAAQTTEVPASYLRRLIPQLGERRTEPRRESP
jgi:hypothetical protein